jgi:hypothetical protein
MSDQDIRDANADWDRAHVDATRARLGMDLIGRADPAYKLLEQDHAEAVLRRRKAGERIAALAQALVEKLKETAADEEAAKMFSQTMVTCTGA